jgi:hypothetical protein
MEIQYTEEQIKILIEKEMDCKEKKEKHKKASLIFDKYDKITGLPQIALSAILSSLTVSNYNNQTTSLGMSIAVMSTALAVLTATSRYCEYGKLKESHKKSSFAFGKLETQIELERMRSTKKPFDVLLEYIITEYNNIKENSRILDDHMKTEIKKKEVIRV